MSFEIRRNDRHRHYDGFSFLEFYLYMLQYNATICLTTLVMVLNLLSTSTEASEGN